MKVWCWVLVSTVAAVTALQAFASLGGSSQTQLADRRAAVESEVRQFTETVAHDVTAEGPIAWKKFFADVPQFFMAVNGKLAFADGQSAANALPQIASQFKSIELHWGDDLRLDPLTDTLCNVASSYTEKIEMQPGANGPQGTESGYFTGVAEKRSGHWQFRNAHWSQPLPVPATKTQ